MNARLLSLAALILFPVSSVAGGGNRASGAASGSIVSPVPSINLPAGGLNTGLGSGLKIDGVNAGVSLPVLPNIAIQGQQGAPQKAQASAPSAPAPQNAGSEGESKQDQVAPQAIVPEAQSTAPEANNERTGQEEAPAASAQAEAAADGAKKTDGELELDITVEEQQSQGAATFDGAGKRGKLQERLSVMGRTLGAKLVGSRLAGMMPHGIVDSIAKKSGVPTPPAPKSNKDPYGGPQGENMTLGQSLRFGMKWGMNLLGISALLQFTLLPLLSISAWQLHLPSGMLEGLGRVELLTSMGPSAIAQALTTNPIGFLFFQMPFATGMEELMFRGLAFGKLFLILAAIRPAARFVSDHLEWMPDIFGFRTGLKRLLGDGPKAAAAKEAAGQKPRAGLQRLSSLAFPIAAASSTFAFAVAHFAAWGANPFYFVTHAVLGFGLLYVAYRARVTGLVASWAAHMTVNVVPLLGIIGAMFLGSLIFAQIYSIGLAVFSIGWLFYQWRKHRKLKLLGGGGTTAMLVALLAGSLAFNGANSGGTNDAVKRAIQGEKPVPTWNIQQADPKAKPAPQDTTKTAPTTTAPTAPIDSAAATALKDPNVNVSQLLMTQSDLMAELTAKVKPAVAKVVVKTSMGMSSGSGFVVRKEGLFVTNAHVVDGAGIGNMVTVEFADGTEVQGKVVAMNTDRDIAFVQLPEAKGGWPVLPIGDHSKVREGQLVMALGHPLGLPFSASFGMVSGMGAGRGSIYVHQLQTDAAVNHGNSGGPLVNMHGEVIGINTAIAAPTPESGSIGIGFSITSEFINSALAQYDATGNINSSYMGIIVDMGNPLKPSAGVLVEQVRPGSAAALSGLQPGDIIMGANGQMFPPRQGLSALARVLAQNKPKDKLELAVLRDGEPVTISITLGDK